MPESVPLIHAAPVPVLGALPQRPRRPHDAVVYATRAGELHLIDDGKPMRWRDQMFSSFTTRYEVNMADQQRTVRLGQSPPPSAEGVYSFDVTLDVGFRVYNPVEVVRRNVYDALPILYAHLIHICHQVTGQFSIEDAGSAQAALNQRFASQSMIEDCLLLYKCRARLAPERDYYRHFRDRAEARMTVDDRRAEHELALVDAANQIDLDLVKQQGRLLRAQNERAALAGRPIDARELIAIALERGELSYEDGIARMLQIEQQQAAGYDSRMKVLADNNLLGKTTAAEVLNGPDVALEAPRRPQQPSWDDPLPGRAGRAAQAPAAVIPVYMVLNHSAALAGSADILTRGVQSLLDTLAARPDVAAAVRLTVLGYAGDVTAMLEMANVDGARRLPPLIPRPGARYGAVFQWLLDSVPRDTAALKQQGTAVLRPQVMFLAGAGPDDDPGWAGPRARLVDRAQLPAAPDIIACGVGDVGPATVAGIATRPELAFIAGPGDVGSAVAQFCAFARQHIVGYGQAILDGASGPVVTPPDGFRPVR